MNHPTWPALILILSLAGCPGDEQAKTSAGAPAKTDASAKTGASAKTPEAAPGGADEGPVRDAFSAIKAASESKDFKGSYPLFTEASRYTLLKGMFISAQMLVSVPGKGGKLIPANRTALEGILARHGIPPEQGPPGETSGKPQTGDGWLKEQLAKVTDRAALYGELAALVRRLQPASLLTFVRLETLLIKGERATATVVMKNDAGQEEGQQVEFHRVDGGWLMQLPTLR